MLREGDRVLVGSNVIRVSAEFAAALRPGDEVLGVASLGHLRRVPSSIRANVSASVDVAVGAFRDLQSCSDEDVSVFFDSAARRLGDPTVHRLIAGANALDVESARDRGRSTTRLEYTEKMRRDMVEAFHMWRDLPLGKESRLDEVAHEGWIVEQWRAPLGVVAFVFEGRPNVFADATGVLRTGNVVVFRIGSDALGTARALMTHVITPALTEADLPVGSVVLVDEVDHAAGWALFSDPRVALAVARGSGAAVAELGAIARQSGINVSLHGTGGAWIIAGEDADAARLALAVRHSLDRKVCNTVNTVCIPRSRADELAEVVMRAARDAARERNCHPRIHVSEALAEASPVVRSAMAERIRVARPEGECDEPFVSVLDIELIGAEHEWENNPELNIVLVDSVQSAVAQFNERSPRFIVSIVSESGEERELVWQLADAPFVGDGFTRWVDGQFALLRPELGLSNWQNGRLFGRGGVLSGDSVYTVRLRVRQSDPTVHR